MWISARRVRASAATLLAGMLFVLAACSPDGPTPAPPTPPPSTAPSAAASSSPAVSGAATAIDAYRSMWKAYVDASRVPDPSSPELSKFAQGDALKVFVNGLTSMQRDGLVGKGDVKLSPNVVAAMPNATPPTVDIQDCADTSDTQLVKKDGSPYQDTPGGKRKAIATAARMDDGSWKVISFALLAVGTC